MLIAPPSLFAGAISDADQNGLLMPKYSSRRGPNCGAPTPMPEPSRI